MLVPATRRPTRPLSMERHAVAMEDDLPTISAEAPRPTEAQAKEIAGGVAIARMMRAVVGDDKEIEPWDLTTPTATPAGSVSGGSMNGSVMGSDISATPSRIEGTWNDFVASKDPNSPPAAAKAVAKGKARARSKSAAKKPGEQALAKAKAGAADRKRSASRGPKEKSQLSPEMEAKLDAHARERLSKMPKEVWEAAQIPKEMQDAVRKSMEEFKNMIDEARAPILKPGQPVDPNKDLAAGFLAQMDEMAKAMGMPPRPGGPAGASGSGSCPALKDGEDPLAALFAKLGMEGGGEMGNGFGGAAAPPKIVFPDEEQRKLVAEDWTEVSEKSKAAKKAKGGDGDEASKAKSSTTAKSSSSSSSSSGKFGSFFKGFGSSKKATDSKGQAQQEQEGEEGQGGSGASSSNQGFLNVTQDFEELANMNAGIIGTNMSAFELILKSFENLIAATVNGDEAQLEGLCDVLSLQLFKEATGQIRLKEFETCMLASLRSLLPSKWGSEHEKAWKNVWECVTKQLEATLKLPHRYAANVTKFVVGLDEKEKRDIGAKSFQRLFEEEPKAENYFKQSNARLAFIVAKALDMCVALYHDPVKTVDDVTSLGLRHIMFQAQPEYFQNFVTSVVAEVQKICKDEETIEGLNYALCVIASIMVRTIEQGATPILQAVVKNDKKQLKKALASESRGKRVEAMIGRA